jgi:hypothetical protein
MEVMKYCEAEGRKAQANFMEQCLIILLEARARECIGVASRKTQRKRVRATCEAQGMKMPLVTTIRPEAVVNYA